MAREFPRSWSTFFVRRTVAELRGGGQSCPIFGFLPIFPYKRVKSTFRWPTYSPGVTSRMIPIFPCGSWRSKWVPSGSGVFLRLLVGELGTSKLAKIFAYGIWLYPYWMLLHGASDLDQSCLKMRNSKDGCTFPPNVFSPTPKTPFWGTFQCKTYYSSSP